MSETIKQEIKNIIDSASYIRRKQYPVAKHQIETLKELGIYELIEQDRNFGYTDAARIIEAATDSGKANTSGYALDDTSDYSNPSNLYELLNAEDEEAETVEDANMNAPTTKVQNMVEYGSGLSSFAHPRAEEIVAGYEPADYDKPYPRFTLTFVYDAAGNFEREEYEDIQDLANRMREIADLRTWRKFEPAQ